MSGATKEKGGGEPLVIQLAETMFQDRIRAVSDQLVDTPMLLCYSLVVNLDHRMLICTSCSVVVFPSQLDSHLQRKHGTKLESQHIPLLQKIYAYFALTDDLPILASPVHEIDGLPLFEGVQCSACSQCYTTVTQVHRHFKEQHSSLALPSSWKPVSVQHLTNGIGPGRSYFAVVCKPAVQSSLNDMLSAITRCYPIPKPSEERATSEARLLSPWLRLTRWHELLVNQDVVHLQQLTAHPKVNEFISLRSAMLELFIRASGLIDETSVLVLQKIHSPHPQKG